MTTFTIDEQNSITAFATREEAAATTATPFDSFSTEQELAELAAGWPTDRLVAILNSLAGEKPVKKLKDPKAAISRIWARIQGLGDAAKPEPEPAAKPKVAKKAKGGAQAAKGAPAKGKAINQATVAKAAPKGQKKAATKAGAPREGSKTAQVVAMLQRKNGATLAEIMDKMGWQKHTVRGFMAGAMKKTGYAVESFKPAGGERTYRINK